MTCNNRTNPVERFIMQRSGRELFLAALDFTSLKDFFFFFKKTALLFANFWLRSCSRPQQQHSDVEALQSDALTGPFQPDSYALFPVCSRICVGSVSIPPFPDRNVTRVFSPDSWRRTSTHESGGFGSLYRFTCCFCVNKTQTAYGVAVWYVSPLPL